MKPYNNQQKGRTRKIVEYVVPAEHKKTERK